MQRLRTEREARGWSQSELARRSDMAAPTISTIEAGRFVPYGSQLEKIAAALGWTGESAALLEDVNDDAGR